ncbi:FecCD family ABC transporter permease [Allonocardiopsis opalescens]|uniref:Iron complex transport system permease protein n=1 Tax=Allonocardiopsis opalescens TaxID=1144618 RepID=A0A2T0QE28_9ACTN|nr:iron chelate uptake ABC transporter family permease subunit [Allonocardiopsis opalescens]PRY02165.1 iron complex transport system permease protein [Allonocardiopsis opalescens]
MTLLASAPGAPVRRRGRLVVRIGPFSAVLRLRGAATVVLGALALLGTLLASLLIGHSDVPAADVIATALGLSSDNQFTVWQVRVPRAATGALVGAALAMSGAITQTIMRNPLASPDLLGVTHGASVAVVAIAVAGGVYGAVSGLLAQLGVPLAALAGGLLAGGVLYLLAWRRGIDGYRVLLIGVGMSAVLMNVTLWLLTRGEVTDAGRALVWITGSLNARTWENAVPVAIALAVLVPLALLGARSLDALGHDDDTARGLGVRLDRDRSVLLLLAILLAAIGTAAAGPILFVSLAAPQIALRLAGGHRPPLLASALVGAVLTCGSDLAARSLFGAFQLPVGIITGSLGAAYLIYLLVLRNRKASA